MDNHDDTETLIALVSSLLSGSSVVDHETILEALVLAEGDVQRAAEILNTNTTSQSRPKANQAKRKRSNLDGWFKKARASGANAIIDSIQVEETSSPGSSSRSPIKPSANANSNSKPSVDLMAVLRQPPSPEKGKRTIKSLPPLTLANPSMVVTHTPCTLHPSILPPELACQLFYTMVEASREWKRNKWWLFDRVVESPHRTSFYARNDNGSGEGQDPAEWQEAARFWYNGRMTDPPKTFPPEMEQACQIVERVVNEELRKRRRYRLEYGGTREQLNSDDPIWRANVAASNCYEGAKESVGFHSDQLTYLGPYPTIASLSLGTTRVFRLREVIPTDEADTRQARTFNIPLRHNSLIIMHASCQEKFKHAIPPQPTIDMFRPSIPPETTSHSEPSSPLTSPSTYPSSNCRINITFRFYRPDFRPQSIPKCDCGVPTILRADMKNRTDGETDRYWWACYAGAQNDGKGCKFWKVLDMKKEGRGPCVGDFENSKSP